MKFRKKEDSILTIKNRIFLFFQGMECVKELSKSTQLTHFVFSDPNKLVSLGWTYLRLNVVKKVQTLSSIDLVPDNRSDDFAIWLELESLS